ncbi:MAG: hypothetical protein K6E29_03125 [Cyanobacteria bacterium RUI128]|nr:hypothetical protein [Cyanobacteria bacterium RUI128]
MTESLSLQNLFKAGLTREQFLAKYAELKQQATLDSPSIFGAGMENSIAEIFDTLNTSGDETLDEAEITALMAYSEEDGTNVLSEKDLKVLYQNIANKIKTQYTTDTPEGMYNRAMEGVDPSSSTFIEDLTTQISILNQLKSSRQTNSTGIVNGLQAQIDEKIRKSTELGIEFKTEYKAKSDEVKQLQKEYDRTNAELQRLAQEKHDAELEKAIIQRELDGLDSEQDQDKITQRQNEISTIDRRLNGINDSITSLTKSQSTTKTKLEKARAELDDLTKTAQRKDSSIQDEVDALKNKIGEEETSLKNDIDSYDAQINILTNAQKYAVSRIQTSTAATEGSSDSHNNDNLMSFDELSKSGLKYSGEKGQKLAQTIRSHIKGFTGYCSRHVSNALAESGLGHERAASAHMMDSLLANNQNFKEITVNSAEDLKRLPAGCILVYEAGAARYNATHGHIEVTLGNGTAGSDGITRNIRYTQNMHVFVPVENA